MRLLPILYRPALLSVRNRLRRDLSGTTGAGSELSMALISALVMVSVYLGFSVFLARVAADTAAGGIFSRNIVSLASLAFFVLLVLSAFVAALGSFFTSSDVPLMLSLPITPLHLYLARLSSIAAASSWMLLLFAVPALAAYQRVFNLPWGFIPTVVAASIPFILTAASISAIGAVAAVNLIPAHELKQNLSFTAVIMVVLLFSFSQLAALTGPVNRKQVLDLHTSIAEWHEGPLAFSPSHGLSSVVNSFLPGGPSGSFGPFLALLAQAALAMAAGYLVFRRFYLRGVSLASSAARRARSFAPKREDHWFFRPLGSQFKAICLKDLLVFSRDPAQSLQLLLLFMLSLIYLYNFGALRTVPAFGGPAKEWWSAVLAFSNLILGSFVVSAVATRFVFPSISLEASGITLIRAAPVSVRTYLKLKFFVWLSPVAALSLFLLLSGAAALGLRGGALLVCVLYAVSLSVGLVGLGIGVGAVYARFDWEHPAQVTASFGSLVYMLLSIVIILAASFPLGILLLLSSVSAFSDVLQPLQFAIFAVGSSGAVLGINVFAAAQALSAGTNSLEKAQ